MITVSLSKTINAPAEDVRNTLLDHDQLGRFFSGHFSIKKPATDTAKAGVIREIVMRGQRFCEEIVAVTSTCIHYRIVGDKPLRNHYGSIHMIDTPTGCQLNYLITCQALWWQPSFIIKRVISRDIGLGLTKLKEHFDGRHIDTHGA